jgi:hypothetical protein
MEPETAPVVKGEPARGSLLTYLFVLLCGISTSVLTLAGVHWLDRNDGTDVRIMGCFVGLVIPVGAAIVGFVAGTGYGFAAHATGMRIRRGLLLTVVLLQTAAYLGAEYVEYFVRNQFDHVRFDHKPFDSLVPAQDRGFPSFLEYYDHKARSFAWKNTSGKGADEPLGWWGYFFVLLEAAGFILGVLGITAGLSKEPYCDGCQRYMTHKALGVLPAAVAEKRISKKDLAATAAYTRDQDEAAAKAEAAVARLREAVAAGNVEAFNLELSAAGSVQENNKLPRRVEVSMIWCKSCKGGWIALTFVAVVADKTTRVAMADAAAPPEFVRAIVAG